MTDYLQQMRDDYAAAFILMTPASRSDLDTMLLAAYDALETIPALPLGSFAASHLERLKKDIDAVRATLEQVG